MDDAAALEKEIGGAFAEDVGVEIAVLPISADASDLKAAEAVFVKKGVDKRRFEFAAGRRGARQVLARLGHADATLLRDSDRVPSWPSDVVGSISHSTRKNAGVKDAGGLCVVAAAKRSATAGLGIDIEPAEPVERDIAKMVCTETERARLASLEAGEVGLRTRAIFGAKEAVYKACFPDLREFWSFHQVELELHPALTGFRAHLPEGVARIGLGRSLEGRIVRAGGWLVSAVCLPARRG